nr:hypothetical protein [Streptomyces halobius]
MSVVVVAAVASLVAVDLIDVIDVIGVIGVPASVALSLRPGGGRRGASTCALFVDRHGLVRRIAVPGGLRRGVQLGGYLGLFACRGV